MKFEFPESARLAEQKNAERALPKSAADIKQERWVEAENSKN